LAEAAPLIFSVAVEGTLDQAVVQRLIERSGAALGPVYGRRGKAYLRSKLSGYNRAARFSPWFVMIDLDEDEDCAPELVRQWLPEPAPAMLFRVAVHEIEAWLLGDRERLSRFLRVARSSIPEAPEQIIDAKQAMLRLARQSRRGEIRYDMLPRHGSGRSVGPAYSSRLAQFVLDRETGWRPDVAANACTSLQRGISRVEQLVEGYRGGTTEKAD
jgi:hypothetical protein